MQDTNPMDLEALPSPLTHEEMRGLVKAEQLRMEGIAARLLDISEDLSRSRIDIDTANVNRETKRRIDRYILRLKTTVRQFDES